MSLIQSLVYPVDKEDGTLEIEGAIGCTSLGSLLHPLFYFLCSILLIHRVLIAIMTHDSSELKELT